MGLQLLVKAIVRGRSWVCQEIIFLPERKTITNYHFGFPNTYLISQFGPLKVCVSKLVLQKFEVTSIKIDFTLNLWKVGLIAQYFSCPNCCSVYLRRIKMLVFFPERNKLSTYVHMHTLVMSYWRIMAPKLAIV